MARSLHSALQLVAGVLERLHLLQALFDARQVLVQLREVMGSALLQGGQGLLDVVEDRLGLLLDLLERLQELVRVLLRLRPLVDELVHLLCDLGEVVPQLL